MVGGSSLPSGGVAGTFPPLTTMIVELLRSAARSRGTGDKGQAAGATLAEHDRRFDRVDTELAAIRGELKALEAKSSW